MTQTPFDQAEGLRIGTVDFVSPSEIKVLLDIEAPDSVALNAGGVRPFPRVNGYALIPVDEVYLVGQIEWLTVERAAFPKRRGVQDFGVIDLPFPLRRMSMNPVGTLRCQPGPLGGGSSASQSYSFLRGAQSLPSVGGSVLLPTEDQLRAIIESGEHRQVRIGTSPLAANARVMVDPDRIFGRHLAVLGNTGSGKSCTVAGLVRWSLDAARGARGGTRPNARFIILDPNGEYSRAFTGENDDVQARIFRISPTGDALGLKVPLWFWNSAEWASFTQASAKTQRPLLQRALREVKRGQRPLGQATEEGKRLRLRRYLSTMMFSIRRDMQSGAIKSDANKHGHMLRAMYDDLEARKVEMPSFGLEAIQDATRAALSATISAFPDRKTGQEVKVYRAFSEGQIEAILQPMEQALERLGGLIHQEGPDEDVPLHFLGSDLADHIEILAAQENVSQFLDFLVSRIRTFLSDSRINRVVADGGEVTLAGWLRGTIGDDGAAQGEVAILDLSLVPSEVVHIVTAVTARMVFEALQRYRKMTGTVLPTVLVMEEAHNFVKRYKDEEDNRDAAAICCQVFERIAREGRKFGLGLVLSSQRPSELSPTVLSQCNTFLLHRISNDRDQEMVGRLVPDNLRGLLRDLPTLPSQHAILLGWASELPVLTRIRDLPKQHRPQSDDPDFWDVWTGKDEEGRPVERPVNWEVIAVDWQGGWGTNDSEEGTSGGQEE